VTRATPLICTLGSVATELSTAESGGSGVGGAVCRVKKPLKDTIDKVDLVLVSRKLLTVRNTVLVNGENDGFTCDEV
jgi:hypothetical protein